MAYGLVAAVNVLIIACPAARPCHADVDACRRRARGQTGVLIKNAEALGRMEKVDTLVVDKTGTLTEGKPKVVAIVTASGYQESGFCGSPPASNAPASTRSRTQSCGRRKRAISI
jgi:Cu+-exporting ATPase